MKRLLLLATVFGFAALAWRGAFGQITCSPRCPPRSSTDPLRVCPASSPRSEEGAYFNRCAKSIKLQFCVERPLDLSTDIGYSWEVLRATDLAPVLSKPALPGLFPMSANRPISQDIEIDTPGDYLVRVTATDAKGSKSTPVTFGPVVVAFYAKTEAVIVGVSQYSNPIVPQLDFAAHDAESMQKLIQSVIPKEHLRVHPFVDKTAIADDIYATLDSIAEDNADFCSEDLFIFYFSGHGFISASKGEHYLGAYNVDPKLLFTTGINVPRLFGLINNIGPNGVSKKLVLLDSCFSGLSESASLVQVQSAGKGLIVVNHQLTAKGQILSDVPNNIGDIKAQLTHLDDEEATFGFAAEANVPAEEGVVLPDPAKARHFYFKDEVDETVLQSAIANKAGHGLYTYFLLGNIERQLSPTIHLDLTDDHETDFKPNGDCVVNFQQAQDDAFREIPKYAGRDATLVKRPLQRLTFLPGHTPLSGWQCGK
jgi:hypothetical protein